MQPSTDISLAGTGARAFLRDAAATAARPLRLVGAATLAEAFGAIGFAAALSGALVHLRSGWAALTPWLALLLLSMAGRAAAVRFGQRCAARGAEAAKSALRRKVLAGALLRRSSRALAGETTAAVVDDVEAIDGYISRYLPAARASRTTPVVVLVAAALASPIAAGLLAATLVPFVVLMAMAGSAAAEASRRQLDGTAHLSGLFADRVRALPLVLAFQAEAQARRQVAIAANLVSRRTLAVLRIAFISSAGLEFFSALAVALVAVYAGFRLLHELPIVLPGELGFGPAFFALALAPEVYAPLRRLAATYHDRQLAEAAATRIAEFLATPLAPPTSPVRFTSAPAIAFRGAQIGFADDPERRLGPIDLDIEAGSITALVGPTGCGKTSLLRLLLGEADLAAGSVAVGGLQLADVGSFASCIAWAGQTPVILPGALSWNIALAAPDADEAQVRDAAQRAGLGAMLEAGGMDRTLDERGSGLSGGERRRVGLARAFLKPASVLLLDEPTADLDPAAEAQLVEAIRQAARGRTVLIATHAPALMAIADQVARL